MTGRIMEPASACTSGDGSALTRFHGKVVSLGCNQGFSLFSFILLTRFLCLIKIRQLIDRLLPAAPVPPPLPSPQYNSDNE